MMLLHRVFWRRCYCNVRRSFPSFSSSAVCLDVDVTELVGVDLEVRAIGTQEEALLLPSYSCHHLNVGYEDNKITVRPRKETNVDKIAILVPRRLADVRFCASGNVNLSGKLEVSKNVYVNSRDDSIFTDILRGSALNLLAKKRIESSNLLEGQHVDLQAKDICLNGKLHATSCFATTEHDFFLKSAYCSRLSLDVGQSTIQTLHGILQAHTHGHMEITSLTGSAHIEAESITISFDSTIENSKLRAQSNVYLRTSAEDFINFYLQAPHLNSPTELIIDQQAPITNTDQFIRGRLFSQDKPKTKPTTGAGKINAAAKRAQRWGISLPIKNEIQEHFAHIEVFSLHGTTTLASPLSWVDRIRHNFGVEPLCQQQDERNS